MWSRNRANLYIRDAMADFHPDPKAFLSPPRQGSMYRQKLECTHLIGFGSGAAAGAVTPFADVTSWSFDGVDGELNIPDHADWTLGGGTGNFNLECWLFLLTPFTGEDYVFVHFQDNDNRWFLCIYANGSIQFYANLANVAQVNFTSSAGVVVASTWVHLAVIRGWNGNADDWAITGNGIAVGTATDTSAIPDHTSPLYIAQRGSDEAYMNANIDEIRISNVARWTTDFSTPTEQYTSDANTSLLIHGSEAVGGGTFTDSGNTGHTVSVLGGATQDTIVYR